MTTIKCIIIDDDELARELLSTYVKKVTYLDCVGSFENPLEALSFLKSNKVDLLFLDIQMPDIKGTDFAQLITDNEAKVVFTTAYSEYALQGFELSALDYLLKPITFERFLTAVEKFPREKALSVQSDYITIKSGYDLHRVSLKDIIYIESYGEYVHYHMEGGTKLTAYQSLSKLSDLLPKTFMRIHRSYLVNGEKVSGLKGRDLLLGDLVLPISDSYYELIKTDLFS